ncbi:MAG: glycoside hydrolase family 16 protein [Dysgonamonadaceae bacterium]|jgi:beta-glucanase (GH16 family)|nr:glycoside hydrolase family 16 protein [Dysgonamonadaceae bacterium]
MIKLFKNSFTNALLFFSLCLFACVQNNHQNADEYRLVWEDTFDSPELNTDFWQIEISGWGGGNYELQYYREENISIGIEPETGVSALIITARKEDFSDKKFTSGRLNTQGKVSAKYGKIEARIKLPQTTNGLWPAFWMMGDDFPQTGWPACGEIDILEMGAHKGIEENIQDCYYNGAAHWGSSFGGGNYRMDATNTISPYGLQDGFHLWTVIWDKDAIKMYLDRDKYPDREPHFQMATNNFEDENSTGHFFNKPFFILLNLAVGGRFTGIVGNENAHQITALNADNNYEARMYVDYVRIYQRGDEGEEFFAPK